MQSIKDFYRELADGRLMLAFQPVVWLADSSRVLYHEGLLRRIDAQGGDTYPLAHLEKQALMRELDRNVVLCVIACLHRDDRLRLGCNISARSAVIDSFWLEIIEALREAPSVAARLVIEITESAAPPSIEAASEFVRCLRGLGCRVAIDDFGAGVGTLEFIRQTRPDIVKIDKGYIQRARGEANSAQTLGHLVQLCKTLAPCVIVEGLESIADQELASDCGGEWGQGYLFGRPHVDRLGQRCQVSRMAQESCTSDQA
ncbi:MULTISPECIES: EAL domain-containing protein [unclassified Pseudomonas]|uniref:EAL domain-containing protein n=1 Tax=unclassified Pseudomonas TaxID=196821 RepID=UPI0008396FD9|nr:MULTISPECIES: EAL domain-containing protein [unclassified Pseudomonas]QIH09520.1 EAL domain-containing protein [Pseudomonas sp. BIOMIG1BAC]